MNEIHTWIVHIYDHTGAPIPDLQLQIKGGMPTHQHGLPTQPQLISETRPGEYIIDGFKFNMAGKWQIELIHSTSHPYLHAQLEFDLDHESIK